jgi:hypothetical protein
MLRTVACLLTSLFTFILGVSLDSTYHLVVEQPASSHNLRSIQPLPIERQEPPLRLGIFIGVDGVTFSSNNSRFNLFDDYRERETTILVSPEELAETVQNFMAAGLLREVECTPSFISLPVNHTIIIAWPDRMREFTWIRGDDCRVPERYLLVLEELNGKYHASPIEKLITYNRR